jgi:hypothetical protein
MIDNYDDLILNGFDVPVIENKEIKAHIEEKLREKYSGRRIAKRPLAGCKVVGEAELKHYIKTLLIAVRKNEHK